MGIDVRQVPVRAAAAKFKNDHAAGRKKAELSDAAQAGRSHSAWESGGASNACVSAWQGRLHTLGKQVDAAADAVTRAMDTYMSTDIDVQRRLHQQADWLERS
jgi:hypothetical protein